MRFKSYPFLIFFGFFVFNFDPVFGQNLNVPVIEEYVRRIQLQSDGALPHSFFVRPISISESKLARLDSILFPSENRNPNIRFSILPMVTTMAYNTKRPYGWGNKGMLPNVGFQTYLSGGVFLKLKFLEIQLQPEYVFSQNKAFQGFSSEFPTSILQDRFFYWNNGDNPERFGDEAISRFWWGQSSATLNFGPIGMGISTQNLIWGPGTWNNLIFGSNAEGFPHLTLHTKRPIKTPIGSFEGQLVLGRLENSGLAPSQSEFLNSRYFKPFDGDWRYLNGFHLAYQPSFLKGFFVGLSRTFQQYNKYRTNTFKDLFPIFEVFQKEGFFANGNTVIYDSKGQDQQVAVSFRYFSTQGKFEVYSEFGRRDHAFNWRDFTMNPDHARAYLMGFQKLVPLSVPEKYIQIRGEITHQQESVSRYIRYPGLDGNQTWHTHGLARGFVNRGETLGVGQGVGSNVQTMEISIIEGFNKKGLMLERLANHQDFYYRAFGNSDSGVDPWIDLSLGILWDHKVKNWVLSTKTQFIYAMNYQWQTTHTPSNEFEKGQNLLSFFGQASLVYHFTK